ncbi:MAG: DUF6082 family protein [Pseudomonadota bacterium]
MKTWHFLVIGVVTITISSAYTTLLVVQSWPIGDMSIRNAALFGDSFGFLNAFFTGGAFLLVLWTITIQQRELSLQREEMSKMISQQTRQAHIELLRFSMGDEDLSLVWGSKISDPIELKQTMYVNLILSHWHMVFNDDLISEPELEHLLDRHMKRSPHFRSFWQRNRASRAEFASLTKEQMRFHKLVEAAYEKAITEPSQA